jgi:hypothetical protein
MAEVVMGKRYGKLACFIMAISLIAGCSKEVEVAERKDVCETEEECTRIGDKMIQKVHKKMKSLSQLEEPEGNVEGPEESTEGNSAKADSIEEAEKKKNDVENYFFLASYYINE